MIKIENSVIIEKPVSEVFAYTNNLANSPKWQSGLERIKFKEATPKVGGRFIEVRKIMGREMETLLEITGLETNQLYSAKTLSGPIPYQVQVIFETVEGFTRMTTKVQGEARGVYKMAEGTIANQIEKSLQESGERLKGILEGI
ncbi:MAG: SRPBCC family protein [Chloroflexota bacterium]|nr:MAG: SRPBCC family protein [Chloroflexota bacterium]